VLQLVEPVLRIAHPAKEAYRDLRVPRNSNNIDTLDDIQFRYSSFSKIHSPVPSSRFLLILAWWLMYGIVEIHSRISALLDARYNMSSIRELVLIK